MALSVALPPVASGCSLEGVSRGSRMDDDVFGSLALLLGSSHASPSPSSSSESSGIGSLGGSIKSDSLPSSPHSAEKKLFDEPLTQPKPKKEVENAALGVRVTYGGRDLLDLVGNVRDRRWTYRPAVLPPASPALFFENRSQYHRLGSRAPPRYVTSGCRACGFQWVVAVAE